MIPDLQTLMLPVLKLAEHHEIRLRDVISELADHFELSQAEREERLPSGTQRKFVNYANWAKTYLKQAGLVTYPRYGYFVATEEGRKVLAQEPGHIDKKFLERYEAFRRFQRRRRSPGRRRRRVDGESGIFAAREKGGAIQATRKAGATPDEVLRAAHREINTALAAELLERVQAATPRFFENLIVALLQAMGYGGAADDAARALGQSGGNGVEGVIDQDALGVDQIYVQAKLYGAGNNIGAGDISDFFGALNQKKAQKGIFVTTSAYSPRATRTAKNLGMRIVLIDGLQLSKLMIRYNIGCRDEETLYLKKVDEDFFEDGI